MQIGSFLRASQPFRSAAQAREVRRRVSEKLAEGAEVRTAVLHKRARPEGSEAGSAKRLWKARKQGRAWERWTLELGDGGKAKVSQSYATKSRASGDGPGSRTQRRQAAERRKQEWQGRADENRPNRPRARHGRMGGRAMPGKNAWPKLRMGQGAGPNEGQAAEDASKSGK
jgi:hypothetical protein